MAKVMISLPDDLLTTTDRLAKVAGQSRSKYLQQLVLRDEAQRRAIFGRALDELFDSAGSFGGDSLEFLKSQRAAR